MGREKEERSKLGTRRDSKPQPLSLQAGTLTTVPQLLLFNFKNFMVRFHRIIFKHQLFSTTQRRQRRRRSCRRCRRLTSETPFQSDKRENVSFRRDTWEKKMKKKHISSLMIFIPTMHEMKLWSQRV